MALVDEEAAKLELEKASDCNAQAEELVNIANELRKTARRHVEEADQLRGGRRAKR
jgi:hypothetical protein